MRHPKARVEKYLSLKSHLETKYSEDDFVEQWMIDQAAAFSSDASFVESKLNWLKYLKSQGVFNVYLDQPLSDDGQSLHEIMEDKSLRSKPESIIIYLEEYRHRQELIEDY